MAITTAGKRTLRILQEELPKLGDNASMAVGEMAEAAGVNPNSIKGTLSKLTKEGYIVSEEHLYEDEEGREKKQKRIKLTADGWEADVGEAE